jgi:thioredoxin-like negative regulator of GroEL
MGGIAAIALAIYSFTELNQNVYFGEGSKVNLSTLLSLVGSTFTNKDQYGLPVFAGLMLIGMAVVFVVSLLVYRNRAPLGIALVLFALMPAHSIMTHWSDNEERDHWFGYWFGHDMFTPPPFKGSDGKPLYPEMDRDSVVFGGTDPGRFCPTYMIFCDSFIPHKCMPKEDQNFDRRDCYLITQNALADNTYLCYIRAQYNRSAQIDPPFFQELFRSDGEKQENYTTNSFARLFIPLDHLFINLGDNIEKNRRTYTSWFEESDFTDLPGFASQLRQQSDPLSKYLYDNLTSDTQKLLSASGADKNLGRNLAKDLNVLLERELVAKKLKAEKEAERDALDQAIEAGSTSSSKKKHRDELVAEIDALAKVGPLYTSERFTQVQLSEYIRDFIAQNPQSHTRIRLNRLLLEAAYPKAIAHSPSAVYPDREIITPSVEDSQRCFQEYLNDAQRRLQMNQLKPGEDVKVVDNRVQVSGQVAVMSINGLLTKVIFDKNPKNSFYVEESFPLDWMYPYLTPFNNIMKINRHPLPELTEDIVRRDHEFWSQYSERFIGNWITYDTPLTNITAFVEKTYLRHDFSGFKGDRKFIRDDQAQKAFSKLRSSIGGVYAWRISDPNNHNPAIQQRMIKEAEFAFKQAFAFCPYSPEAVFRYVNLLLTFQRLDDALLISSTCLKLDPYNGQVIDLVKRLESFKHQTAEASPPQQNLQQLEQAVRENPTNFITAFNLAGFYLQAQQTNRAITILDGVLNNPLADANILRTIAQAYIAIGNAPKLQETANKLQALADANPKNFEAQIGLVNCSRHLQQNQKALQIVDQLLNAEGVDGNTLVQVAQECSSLGDYPRLERALEKLVKASPDSAEAWYDLAAIKASLGKMQEVFPALTRSFELNAKRRSLDARTKDLVLEAQKDPRFAQVRSMPEFQRLTGTK